MNRLKAFWLGLCDGLQQPYDLTAGMTYDGLDLQFAWDWGANIGQFIGSLGRTRSWQSEEEEPNHDTTKGSQAVE